MGGAISAVTRVFDALCASPFATRMGDTHHVATCTRTAVDRYRPDDFARAPDAHVKDRARRPPETVRSDAPASSDRLAPARCARAPAAQQRPRLDAEIVGGEVSWPPSLKWRRRDALHSALLAALIKSVHLAVSASILRDSSAPDNQAGSRARVASFCCKSGSA